MLICINFRLFVFFFLQNEDVKKLEEQITDKEKVLNAGTNKIAKIDEEIMQLDQELQELNSQGREKTEIKSKKSSLVFL